MRANFNYKNKSFNELYEFNPVIFFNDTVSNEINIEGVYEKNQLDKIKNMLSKDIFLDIGANIGNHTLYFYKHFSKVYAYEPHPLTYKLLEINTKYKSNINIFNFGLSEKNQVIDVAIKSQNNISGEGFRINDKKANISEKVIFKNFDELFEFSNQLSFIKIDVEGNELDVLKSMKKNLINNQAIILLEFDIDNFSESNEVIVFLKNVGYNFFYYFETNKFLDLRIRNLLLNFFKIFFMGYREKIFLKDSKNYKKNKNYLNQNIIVSKYQLNLSLAEKN